MIDLDEVVQDGVRVRAAAGSGSYRRRKTLRRELKKAKRLVKGPARESDADASHQRIEAARHRAARERERRVQAALDKLAEIEAERKRRAKTNKQNVNKEKEPRASTTDPQARVMKMADGGFRPADNCQLATVAGGQIVVEAEVVAVGSDRGLLRPMIERIERRHDRRPKRYLVDGGFNKNDDTEWAWRQGVRVYGPAVKNKHNTDPYAPRAADGPGVAAWRRRMKSRHGKAIYRRRACGEGINARFRQWRLYQFTVRGLEKVNTVLRWYALASIILAGHRLIVATA